MARSNKRLKRHLKGVKQQIKGAIRSGNSYKAYLFQREIRWIKAQMTINAHKGACGMLILNAHRPVIDY